MPSLLSKYKKRRESHKGDDGSSVASHEADQRSPSGSSVRSGDAAGLAGVAGAGAGGAGLAAVANGQQQFSQQSSNVQQAAQQAGQKVLHSPFLGQRSPQAPANAQGSQPTNGQGAPAPPVPQGQPQSILTSPNAPGGVAAPQQQPGSNGHPPGPLNSASTSAGNKQGFPGGNSFAPQHPNGLNAHPQFSPGQPRGPPHGPSSGPHSPISPPPHGQPPHGQPPHAPLGRGPAPSQGPLARGPPAPHGGLSPNMHGAAVAGPVDPAHERDRQFQQRYRQPPHEAYRSPLSEPSETPWAEYHIQRACPSPRFGHSANYIAARDGELFIMGGIRDSDIMDDLWVVDTNMLTGYQLVTEGARGGARVGHSSLVLGNAHVMFGGDTKIDETDPLDDNLYLLNTSSLKWTVAQPVGPRPSGRYGHSLSNVGARIYVFGGQVDEQFYNDMWAFDLQSWRSPTARWELIQPTTEPPTPRTNHTVVTWNDKLYLFGGANGDLWYSDTWCFDPVLRRWDQLDCTGYVPAPCQGHAATIIGDVMYVFGGMSSQGVLIDQLFALKLTTLKWYTFQNLGPGPSPRSGHSLTAFANDKILVWGGTDQGNSAYVLDVSRINYPDDHPESAAAAAHDAPAVMPPARPSPGPGSKEVTEMSPQPRPQSLDNSGPTQGRANPAARNSMLFAKRGSVIAPSSPLRGLNADTQSINESPQPAQNHSQLSQVQNLPVTGNPSAGSPTGRSLSNDGGDSRTPNRTHVTPSSYISENEGSSDERFVSAVDLNDDQGHVPNPLGQSSKDGTRRPRGHTRGQSLGVSHSPLGSDSPITEELDEPAVDAAGQDGDSRNNTLTRSDVATQDQNFQNMESELGGMPGGLPQKPPTGADESRGLDGDQSGDQPLGSTAEDNDSLSSRNPGLRRSQPQTNLSLRNLDEDPNDSLPSSFSNDNDQPQSQQNGTQTSEQERHAKELAAASIGAAGVGGAGIIGLSDQMNLPPNSHSAEAKQTPNGRDLNQPGLSVGTPAAQDNATPQPHVEPTRDLSSPTNNVTAPLDRSTKRPQDSPQEPLQDAPLDRPQDRPQDLSQDLAQDRSQDLRQDRSQDRPLDRGPENELDSARAQTVNKSADPGLYPKTDLDATNIPGAPQTDKSLAQAPQHHTRSVSSVSNPANASNQVSSVSEDSVKDPKSQSSPKERTAGLPEPPVSRSAETFSTANGGEAGAAAALPPGTPASVAAELAQLRQQLHAYRTRDLDGEHHKLKQDHAARQRDLLDLRDSHGQLQNENSKLHGQHQDLQQRYAHVQKLMDGHVNALQAQQKALEEAKAKLQSQQEQLSRLPTLESENTDLKHKLQTSEAARKHAEEQLELLNQSHSQLRSAHTDLSDKHSQLTAAGAGGAGLAAAGASDLDGQVNQLVQLWAEYNRGPGAVSGEPGTRDLNSTPGDEYRGLYETHKSAADSAQRELEAAYSEQAQLKAQLRELSAAQSTSPSSADLDLLKDQHQTAISQLEQQHQDALLRAKSASSADTEDLRERLRRLEASYENLNSEYQQAVDLSKNQQSALARTREELNMSRAHVQRLEEQLEDASIHAPSALESGDVSAQSVGSARTDQAALLIRDLRTQIVILEEEIQSQREQIMKLKKAALTTQ